MIEKAEGIKNTAHVKLTRPGIVKRIEVESQKGFFLDLDNRSYNERVVLVGQTEHTRPSFCLLEET